MSDAPHNDPLLSAFLDGELSQDLREQVEKRIAEKPGLRQLLQQWKEQGDAIRALPKTPLQKDLTATVLAEIARRHASGGLGAALKVGKPISKEVQGQQDTPKMRQPFSSTTWRKCLVGIASLAGVLFLGIFLFGPNRVPNPVAKNAATGIDQKPPLEKSLSEKEIRDSNHAKDQTIQSGGESHSESTKLESNPVELAEIINGTTGNVAEESDRDLAMGSPAPSETMSLDVAANQLDRPGNEKSLSMSPQVDPGASASDEKASKAAVPEAVASHAPSPAAGRPKPNSFEDTGADGPSIGLAKKSELGDSRSMDREGQKAQPLSDPAPTKVTDPKIALPSHPTDSENRGIEGLGGGGGISGELANSDEAEEMKLAMSKSDESVLPAVSIPQVYFVEFAANERPLATISEVFSRNQIEIQLPESANDQAPADSASSLKSLASQSQLGVEAIFVVATRSQLSRAMNELSDRANISGFEVTSDMLKKMLMPGRKESKPSQTNMEQLIVGGSKSNSALFKGTLEGLSSDNQTEQQMDKAGEPEAGASGRTLSLAQQLRPIERNLRSFPALPDAGENTPAKGSADESRKSDSLDQLMQSKRMVLFWNHSQSAIAPPLASGAPGKYGAAENEGELVQFLLLIRTAGSH